MKNRVLLMLCACALAACGSRVSGVYLPQGHAFLDRMNFKGGGKVDLTFMTMTKEGTYAVDGSQVKVTNGGDTQVFKLDEKGCLDGGALLGRYCH